MLTETTTNEERVIDVPLIALKDGDVIRRHPDGDEDVVWKPVTWQVGDRAEENASVTYTTPNGGGEHRVHEFGEPHPWVTVQAPPEGVTR